MDEIEDVRIEDLERLAECAASWPKPGATASIPRRRLDAEAPALRRWSCVRDAIVAWHQTARPDEGLRRARACFADLDPVERDECERQLAAYTRTTRHGGDIRLDPPAGEWTDSTGDHRVRLSATFSIATPGERETVVRLRTGRQRTSPLQSGVMHTAAGDVDHVDALLGTRDGVVEMDAPSPDWADTLQSLTDAVRRLPPASQRRPTPGGACFSGCQRVPYCGAFPIIGSDTKPPTSSRLLVLSKTAIATALRCERRAAWKHVFNLPDEEPDAADDTDLGHGQAAHELLAHLVLEPDQEAALPELLDSVSPVDRPFVEEMARRHLRLEADEPDHPIEYRRSELTAGVCFDVRDAAPTPTVVALLARLDATGRGPDGAPAVVEHKTGRTVIEIEADLYAVVGWHLAARSAEPTGLTVHHHWLGSAEHETCERTSYAPDVIAAATARLREIATTAARWDPADALSPPPRTEYDAYCSTCPFERRCARHGGPRRR